jgi:tetratricopeptide (TPR) repeat protein
VVRGLIFRLPGGGVVVADRLLVDLGADGQAAVLLWPDGGLPEEVSRTPLAWPLDGDALENLRWYLEDYLLAPFGVWEDRGPAVQAKLAQWGDQVFGSVFGSGPARDAYQRARDRGLELVFRSASPGPLSWPWELMRDPAGPVALNLAGVSRALPVAALAQTAVTGNRLRVLMVISRPEGTGDIEYQMIARPLLARLEAVRGQVDLVVLRPPTLDALREALTRAVAVGEPFQVVHFDGHGALPGRAAAEGVLGFEKPGGGSDQVAVSRVAAVLAGAGVPVVVLNACQSGAVGKDLEAAVATRLLRAGCAAVVAMAYSVYAVAAAEFMAIFYERLFAGDTVSAAVTAGRRRLFENDGRPSPKGELPLADWLVPVHYLRRDVAFPQARTIRPATAPSLDVALDQIRAAPSEAAAVQDPLAAVGVFVGRDDLFYQLEAAARLQRVMVLAGPGGAGKTELAKGFARWWRDTGGVDDPRLVFWHSFEAGVASFGLDGVITSIGLEVFGADFAGLDPPQRLDAVKRLLGQYRALLVWDNFESVREMPDPAGVTPPLDEAGCDALKGFLEWVRDHSNSAVIITSRTDEGWLGQRRITVGGLNRAEAAEYADHLLAPYPAAQQRRARRSFGELLDWLDGHPLAMRLTLPRLDATDPAELLADLHGTIPLPAEDDPDAGRTTSLPASITYSYAHLSGQARRLLPAVSLLHGVADENVLTAFSDIEGVPARFAGVSRQEWTTVLQDAARVGLLTDLGIRMYRIHPALPGYLAAGWHAGDPASYVQEREACEQALCTACAAVSHWLTGQIRSGDAGLAYAVIGLQRRILGAMLGHGLDQGRWDDAEDIARALDSYWDARGLGEEARIWADRILNATVDHRQAPLESARALWLYTTITQANRQQDSGHPDQAADTYRRILAYLQDQPETEWVRTSLSVIYRELGNTAYDRGRLEEAEDWTRQALTISEELGNRPGIALAYHQLASNAQAAGRLEEAEDWARHALTIFEELGDRPRMAFAYAQLGVTAQTAGRLDEAEDWYRQALTIRGELGDRPRIAHTYHQLSITAQLGGRLDEAEDWSRQALTIFEELGDRPYMALAYGQLGNTAYFRERLDEAHDWYRRGLAIFEELGDRPRIALIYHQLSMTARAGGRLEEAEEWARHALTIFEELGDRPHMAIAYAQLGNLTEDTSHAPLALQWYIRCVTLFDHFPSPLTGTGPSALARLSRQLGMPALEAAWQQITGQPVPQAVRDYIASHHDDDQPGGTP